MKAQLFSSLLVLYDLIIGGSRPLAVDVLKLEDKPVRVQDEVLLWCFVAAVGAFFFVRKPIELNDITSLYRLTHPPQAARMNSVMQTAVTWCKQFRPDLTDSLSKQRFRKTMDAVGAATWGGNNVTGWGPQVAFLYSEHATEYFRKLDERVRAYKAPTAVQHNLLCVW